ncbi:MAG: hypothetical protein R3F51_14430 [Cyanobacteriota/Melainabacteria group bacterium]
MDEYGSTAFRTKYLTLLLTLVAVLICVHAFNSHSMMILLQSYDTGWLIRTGEYVAKYGPPQHDIFGWTYPDRSFIAYQWLFELLVYRIYSFGGLRLLSLCTCLLVGSLFFFVLPLLWIRRGVPVAAPYAVLSLVLFSHWFNIRPQLLSYYFFLLLIEILESQRKKKDRSPIVWILLPVMALWINIHSFWVFGLLIIIIYWFGEVVRTHSLFNYLSFLILFSFISALFFNPYGFQLSQYLLTFIDGSQYMGMHEVKPAFHYLGLSEVRFVIAYILIFWIIAYKNRTLLSAEAYVLTGFMTLMAFSVARYLSVAAIVLWPYFGLLISKGFDWKAFGFDQSSHWFRIPVLVRYSAMLIPAVVLSLLIALFRFPDERSAEKCFYEDSLEVIDVLRDHVREGDRIFNDPETGSWLILAKAGRVAIDTRFDMYPKKFVEKVFDVLYVNESGGQSYLNSNNITYVVAPNSPVVKLNDTLRKSTEWFPLVSNHRLVLWARTSNPNIEELVDRSISSSNLSKQLIDSTVQSRCLQYFQRAKSYSEKRQYRLAVQDLSAAVQLLPESRFLRQKLQEAKQQQSSSLPRPASHRAL